MKSKIIGIAMLILSAICMNGYAQLNAFSVSGIPTFQTDSLSAGGDTLTVLKCKLSLTDTTTVKKIHIKVGTTVHGTDALDTFIEFDNPQSLPAGMEYKRMGENIILTLGYFMPELYYLDVHLEDVFGNVSSTKSAKL